MSKLVHSVDHLVIGSGIAGLTFALRVADRGTVAILTKTTADETSTRWAQGGIASVTAPDDDFASHVEDTLHARGMAMPAATLEEMDVLWEEAKRLEKD